MTRIDRILLVLAVLGALLSYGTHAPGVCAIEPLGTLQPSESDSCTLFTFWGLSDIFFWMRCPLVVGEYIPGIAW